MLGLNGSSLLEVYSHVYRSDGGNVNTKRTNLNHVYSHPGFLFKTIFLHASMKQIQGLFCEFKSLVSFRMSSFKIIK